MTDTAALAEPVGAFPPGPQLAPLPDPGTRGAVAQVIAAAVDTVAGARRSKGTGIEVATQYRGGRTVGVRLGAERVEVHIVAERPEVVLLAEAVHAVARRALNRLGDHRTVNVYVDDLDVASLSDRGS